MNLAEDDKNTILLHMTEIGVKGIDDPVIMVDECKDGIVSEVTITSAEGFEWFSIDNGVWDLHEYQFYKSDGERIKKRPPPFHDVCVVNGGYQGAFSVTKDNDPEFIEECKQAIQLGRL